jgi:hypothetical protein
MAEANQIPTSAKNSKMDPLAYRNRDMTTPQITIHTPFTQLSAVNYYDYQFGGYCGEALQMQQSALNLYLTFMFKPTSSGRRGVYAAYLDPDLNDALFNSSITTASSSEGFVTMAIDQTTQNPFFAWHAQYNAADAGTADPRINCYFSADNYEVMSMPGSLFNREKIIENLSDEFCYIWPAVYIGPSPNNQGRRVYVFANNSGTRPNGNPSSNVKMAYADYTSELFNGSELTLNWQYRTFDYLDAIHNSMLWARAYPSFLVKDNKVIIGGFVNATDGISSPTDSTQIIYQPHNVFYLVNENYGEGDFQLYTFDTNRAVPNPTNQGGVDDGTGYASFEIQESFSSHRNLVMDNLGRLHFVGNYATTFLETAGASEDDRKYWPNTQAVKDIVFDLETESVLIKDLSPKSTLPYDNQLFPVWDLNQDNQPDSYDTEGNWQFAYKQVPMYYHNSDNFFHYNYFRQTQANSQGWMAAIWSDCTKSYLFNVEQDTDYEDYSNVPELALIFSRDNGNTWSSPVYINSLDTPELSGKTLAISYLAPQVEVIGPNMGRLHIMSFDDLAYGSAVYNDGANTGGNVLYFNVEVDFSQFTANDENNASMVQNTLKQNYPNPFNPETNISFNLNQNDNVELSIYNVKGQLVKTLHKGYLNQGTHTIRWNGQDSNNKNVASGVYFYKLSTPKQSEMKKMLLLK